MRSIRLPQVKRLSKHSGFTLIEMLVIAPLVLIVITGLVGAMISMIGDSLLASSRVNTAYSLQDALGQIEQDTRVAINFMGTFSYFSSPQGRDGNTAPFSYSSNNDLILTQQATTTSPYSTARDLVYYANQPAACSNITSLSGNHALASRVIYFLVTNSDGTKTLWRRTIVNPWNLNATPDGSTVCSAPWQRDSCPQGSAVSNTPSSTCQSVDQKMLDNVTAFTPTFYDSSGAVTTDPTKAYSVSVSITVQQTVTGSTLSQTSVIRASRRNDVPATPVPSTPTISIYNPGVNSYNNPILTSFQWSANGAYTYLVSTQINGGAWSTPQNITATNISVSSPPNATVSIQVTAVNDSGNSTSATYSTTSALFSDMNLAGNWTCIGSGWQCPSFTRTTAGVVVLRGVLTGGSGTITTLPAGFRPDKELIFSVVSGANNSFARINVSPDGTVAWQNGGDNSYLPIDVTFMSSDFDSSLTWAQPTLLCPSGCTTPWTNFSGGGTAFGKLQVANDSIGRSELYGTVSTPSPYPPANNTDLATLVSPYKPASWDIYPGATVSGSTDGYSSFAVTTSSVQFRTNTGTSWKSINAMYYPSGTSTSWQTPTLQNSWVNYGSTYSSAQYTKSSDHIVTLRGLVKGGTTAANTTILTLPSGYRPSNRMIFVGAGYSGSVEVPVRLDLFPTGDIVIKSSSGVANNYISLADISFYQDGN